MHACSGTVPVSEHGHHHPPASMGCRGRTPGAICRLRSIHSRLYPAWDLPPPRFPLLAMPPLAPSCMAPIAIALLRAAAPCRCSSGASVPR